MPNPKHVNPKLPERTAVAPYNFVPLPDVIVPAEELPTENRYDLSRRTGHIDCTLTTETPLYVRCPLTLEQFQKAENERGQLVQDYRSLAKNTPEFFYTDATAQPVIPGSTLRGLLRSLVEIVSYSKVGWVSDRALFYRAVGDTTSHGRYYRQRLLIDMGNSRYQFSMRAGYIEQQDGNWCIRPAINRNGLTFRRIEFKNPNLLPSNLSPWQQSENAYEIFFKASQPTYHKHNQGRVALWYSAVTDAKGRHEPGFEAGVLVRTGPISRKHMDFVFHMPDMHTECLPIRDDVVQAYRDQITPEQQALLGNNGVLVKGQPVFYYQDDDNLLFGHAMMFRVPYPKSPYDLLTEESRHPRRQGGPLLATPQIDIAEAIFGFVRQTRLAADREQGRAGRIFVSDAQLVLKDGQQIQDIWFDLQPLTPFVLGSPKPTTFQHYLVQQTPDPIRTDRINQHGKAISELRLADYNASSDETAIRGHKLYWHKGNVSRQNIEDTQFVRQQTYNDSQHTYFKPVNAGVSFTFRIYFENITDVELGALLYVLRLAEKFDDEGPQHRLKLGMGKPLGMGAVSLTHNVKISERDQRYNTLLSAGRQVGAVAWQWDDPVREIAGDDAGKCVEAFVRYVLNIVAPSAQRLSELPRIQCLLALLSWPGPNPYYTRYMEIERPVDRALDPPTRRDDQTVNEYKTRRVLPTPTKVTEDSDAGTSYEKRQ